MLDYVANCDIVRKANFLSNRNQFAVTVSLQEEKGKNAVVSLTASEIETQ